MLRSVYVDASNSNFCKMGFNISNKLSSSRVGMHAWSALLLYFSACL
jgi:hypothetical protein